MSIEALSDKELIASIRTIREPRKNRDGYDVSNYYVDDLVRRLEALAIRVTNLRGDLIVIANRSGAETWQHEYAADSINCDNKLVVRATR